MNKRSRMYPSVRVDRANVPAVGQAGGVLLTRTVEASGLGLVLSQALGLWRKPLAKHDPAKVLLDLAMSLVLGGDSCRDTALLRSEPGIYGPVASDPTISRTITALAADVDRVEKAVAKARAAARDLVWGLADDKAPGHDRLLTSRSSSTWTRPWSPLTVTRSRPARRSRRVTASIRCWRSSTMAPTGPANRWRGCYERAMRGRTPRRITKPSSAPR